MRLLDKRNKVMIILVFMVSSAVILIPTARCQEEKSEMSNSIKISETQISDLYNQMNKYQNALTKLSDKVSDSETEIKNINDIKVEKKEELLIPDIVPYIDCSFKSFMDYRYITDPSSDQYALQSQAYTDNFGLRRFDDYYMVAVGTYYTSRCGTKFKITTDTGNVFKVIVGDIKPDCDTDHTNRYAPLVNGNGNVLEFIVDTPFLSDEVKKHGNLNYYEHLSGDIIRIERIC